MAVSDPNKFASVGNVKALFDSGEGFVHEANIDPSYALVPLTGTTGQVLQRTEGGVGWGKSVTPVLLWEGSAHEGSLTINGISGYSFIGVVYSSNNSNNLNSFIVCRKVDHLFKRTGSNITEVQLDAFIGNSLTYAYDGRSEVSIGGDSALFSAKISGDTITSFANYSGHNAFTNTSGLVMEIWGIV